jgi:hypothetical protein
MSSRSARNNRRKRRLRANHRGLTRPPERPLVFDKRRWAWLVPTLICFLVLWFLSYTGLF